MSTPMWHYKYTEKGLTGEGNHGGEQEERFLQHMEVVQTKGKILKYFNSGKPKQLLKLKH